MAGDEYIGRVINREWRVVKKIGQGGMGTVWMAEHQHVKKLRCAVKQIKSSLADVPEVAKRFLREVNLMAGLEGADNIVRVRGFSSEEGFGTYVLMDLIDGPSLAEIIRQQGALPYELVLKYCRQIAGALALVHGEGVVHRDIKGPNVLIDTKRQKAFLTDFGIAKELAAEADQTIGESTATTSNIQYIGTPRYSCPEQLRVEYPPQPLWDIYSMGALLYEAYSGLQYLPQWRLYPEFLRHVGMDNALRIELSYPTPPPASFAELVADCLRLDPRERLPSALALTDRLAACEAELRSRGVRPAGGHPAEERIQDEVTRLDDLGQPRLVLREEIEKRLSAIDELEGTLVAFGANLPLGPASETLSAQLRDISMFEGEAKYQEALGHLETLREQASNAQRRVEAAVHDEAVARLAALEDQRRELERRAGPWLERARLEASEAALAVARRSLDERQWRAVGEAAREAADHLRDADLAAQAAARDAVEKILARAADDAAAVVALEPDGLPRGFDLEALRAQALERLDAGECDAAHIQADAAREAVADARARLVDALTGQLRAAREQVSGRLADVDEAAARALEPDWPASVTAALERADGAEHGGDLAGAVAAAADAVAHIDALSARVAAAERAALAADEASLREQLAASAALPDRLVRQARDAAERCLHDLPEPASEARAALAAAAAGLAAAMAELPAYAEADARRSEAAVARAALGEVPLAARDRRAAERIDRRADAAFDERRWGEAARGYEAAAGQYRAFVDAHRTRTAKERCVTLASATTEALAELETLHAAASAAQLAVPGTAIDVLQVARDAAVARQEAGEFDPAAEAFASLGEEIRAGDAAHRAALAAYGERVSETLAGEARALFDGAGALVGDARVERHRDLGAALEAARASSDWPAFAVAAAALTEWLQATAAAVTETARQATADEIAALATALADLERGGAAASAPDIGALRNTVDELITDGQWAAAYRAVEQAKIAVDAAVASQRQAEAAAAAAAGAALDEAFAGLDRESAASCAADDLAAAEQARADGLAAQARGDAVESAARFRAGQAAVEAAKEAVAREAQRALALLRSSADDLLGDAETAPPLLVEAARTALAGVLAAASEQAPAAARAAIQAAMGTLQTELDRRPSFEAAHAAQQAAAVAASTLDGLPVSAAELRKAQGEERAGGEALERRDWDAAAGAFERAAQARAELAGVGRQRQAEAAARAAERARAVAALQPLVERARDAPPELVGAALGAAQQCLADQEASAESLGDAARQLSDTLAEQPRFAAAAARRHEALEVAGTLAQRRAPRALRRAARARQAEAEASFDARRWDAAVAQFDASIQAWQEIERAPAPSSRRWPLAGVAVVLLLAGGYAIYSYIRPPTTVVQTKPKIEEPPAAPPLRPHIASASPPAAQVQVASNATQPFAIALADAGDTKPTITWLFDGKPVDDAAGKAEWNYVPGADARSGAYDVEVRVGAGTAADERRRWDVSVNHVNRPPTLDSADPKPDTPLHLAAGQNAHVEVAVSDPDGDPLHYAWTLDGKSVGGDRASVDAPITAASKQLALAVRDGDGQTTLTHTWPIEPQVLMQAQPAALASLPFGESKKLSFVPESPIDGLQVAWAVNGEKRADATAFTFTADDPSLVGKTVEITASARDARGAIDDHTWSVAVQKPAPPRLTGTPSGSVLAVPLGKPQTFSIDVAPVAAAQKLDAPVFTVNDKPQSSTGTSFTFTAPAAGTYTVVASVRDQFDQRATRPWQLKVEEALQAQPAALPSLRFGESRKLTFVPTSPIDGLQVAWAVNGEKRADATAFTFTADDPSLVGKTVKITASARDARGAIDDHTWSVAIQKPAPPRLTGTPSGSALAVALGKPQTFSIDVAPVAAAQKLDAPVFTVNDKPQSSNGTSFTFTAPAAGTYTVVASVRDQFDQRATRPWQLKVEEALRPTVGPVVVPIGDITAATRTWLNEYKAAVNAKNVDVIAQLLGLGAAQSAALRTALESQRNLEVDFSDVTIAPTGADAATATYTRNDHFKDPTGKDVSRKTSVTQRFKLKDGRAALQK